MTRKKRYWIQEAIKKPGSFRAYVQRVFGQEGFDKLGRIKVSVLKYLAKSAPTDVIRRRARLALTLRKLRSKDPADAWRYAIKLKPKRVEILILSRDEVEELYKSGKISESDWKKYWEKSGAENLIEFAIFLNKRDVEYLKDIMKEHKGFELIDPNYIAIRCGGANQKQDPLNVFIIA
jgi:hypothetical protein